MNDKNIPKPGLIKVAANSNATSTASHLSHMISEDNLVIDMRAVGAAAVNQAVKAIAIARGFVAPRGYNLHCVPSFDTVEIDGKERSACLLRVHATT